MKFWGYCEKQRLRDSDHFWGSEMKTKLTSLFAMFVLAWTVLGCSSGMPTCVPYDKTICREGSTYWVDSCGNQGDKAGDCECGCNEDFSGCKTPSCGGKECGPDGCGGTCAPGCSAGETCNDSTGQCECSPDCSARACGPDPACGESCGTCTEPEVCNDLGQCECVPDCSERVCACPIVPKECVVQTRCARRVAEAAQRQKLVTTLDNAWVPHPKLVW